VRHAFDEKLSPTTNIKNILRVRFTHRDTVVLALHRGGFSMLSLPTLVRLKIFGRCPEGARAVQFNAAGCHLLADLHSVVHVYDIMTETLIFQFDSSGGVCYSFDFNHIYGSAQNAGLLCWDANAGCAVQCPFTTVDVSFCRAYHSVVVVSASTVILM
jgi:hypothetical protein